MPFKEVPTKVDFPAQERELIKFWEDSAAFRNLTDIHAHDPHWSFIDGPITANNPMGDDPASAAEQAARCSPR